MGQEVYDIYRWFSWQKVLLVVLRKISNYSVFWYQCVEVIYFEMLWMDEDFVIVVNIFFMEGLVIVIV